ncbi:MAG: hypothetical protein R3B40_27745 [Polyangiales bacterium]|nr:hypothetical protein [Sandaracinaceae bacterium]
MDDEERKVLGTAAAAVVEGSVAAGLGAVGALAVGSIGAVAFPIAFAGLVPLIKGHVQQRTEARARAYNEALVDALMKSDLTFEEFASLDEAGTETVFQAYRRAVDAYDPAVVPALGRLTAMALRDGKDRFFVGVGRMLEQMTAGEFLALRELSVAASSICWHDTTKVVAAFVRPSEVCLESDSRDMQPRVLPASEDLITVLGLLGRHRIALTQAEDPNCGTLGGQYLAWYLASLSPATAMRLKTLCV